jgi:hypothetical protein
MPVQRFRRVEDVPPPRAHDPRDAIAMQRVWAHLRLATEGLPPAFASGVRRYESLEAAAADRRAAEVARMRLLRGAAGASARPLDPHG